MKHLGEIRDTVNKIIGEGITRYTIIQITKNTIEIITDEFITTEKIATLDKYFKEKSYIEPRGDKIAIIYPLPPAK